MRFQCHVGHGWSWDALLTHKSDQLEAAVWAASRLFVERAILQRQIASRLQRANGDPAQAGQLDALSQIDERKSRELQEMLGELALVASEQQAGLAPARERSVAYERQLSPVSRKESSNAD